MKSVYMAIVLAVAFGSAIAQNNPVFRMEDRIRIREAMLLKRSYGEKIWKGISQTPFTILLIRDSVEFLINHPNPGEDFQYLGEDSMLQSKIYFRKAKYNPGFLATFPAVNGMPTIVAGTPEQTGKNSSEWIITLLHEHFHQYQWADPHYRSSINELDLSRGDQTGMWMLNYPFPYEKPEVEAQYSTYARALVACIKNLENTNFKTLLDQYMTERNKLKALLDSSDYRYFSLQIWQEGMARYAEFKFLSVMTGYTPTVECSQLSDFQPFSDLKNKYYKRELNNITALELSKEKRIVFYSLGFGEGLLLDKINKNWRDLYNREKFFIEKYFRL
ncbi:MAG TPA: hypothetical protein VGD17_15235 [Chitinophagaceae bacterium]